MIIVRINFSSLKVAIGLTHPIFIFPWMCYWRARASKIFLFGTKIIRRLRKCEGWLIRFGTVLVWINPNYFGSLYSNPNKSYGWRCSTVLSKIGTGREGFQTNSVKLREGFTKKNGKEIWHLPLGGMHGHPNTRFFPLMGTVPSTKYCWAPGSCPSVKILSKSLRHGSLGEGIEWTWAR